MKRKGRFPHLPVILAIIAVVLLPVGVLAPLYQQPVYEERNNYSYSAYGDQWDALSLLREELGNATRTNTRTIITTPLFLNDLAPEDAKQSVMFIIGVEKQYSGPEIEAIHAFVHKGGNVVMANANDLSNALSERYGVKFYRERVLDASFSSIEQQNVSIFECNASLNSVNYRLRFNSPGGLEVDTGKAHVLCQTSQNSSLDLNGNGLRDLEDKRGPIPLVAVSDPGLNLNTNGGQVACVSSPSLFVNQELNKANNLAFIKALVEYLLRPDKTSGMNGADAEPEPEPEPVPVPAKAQQEPLMIFDESRHAHPRGEQVVFNVVSFLAYLTKHPLFVVITFINLAALGLFWWLAHPRPKPFRHIDRLAGSNPRSCEALDDIRYLRELMILKLFTAAPIANNANILSLDTLEQNLSTWDLTAVEAIVRDRVLAELICLSELSSTPSPVLELTIADRKLNAYTLRKKILRWEYHENDQKTPP